MMIWLLGGAGAALAVAGNIPAIKDVLSGKFAPQVLSWTGWAAIMLIGGWGSWRGSVASGGYVLACAVGSLAVAALALRVPASEREAPVRVRLWPSARTARLDLVCLPGAVAGLTLLALVRDPGWSVGVSVATDAVLYVPTFADGWRKPAGQPLLAYSLFAAGAAATAAAVLLAAHRHPAAAVMVPLFAALAYPAYLLAADGAMSVLVAVRRGRVPAVPAGDGPPSYAGSSPGPARGTQSGLRGAARRPACCVTVTDRGRGDLTGGSKRAGSAGRACAPGKMP